MGRKRTLASNVIRLRIYLKQTDGQHPANFCQSAYVLKRRVYVALLSVMFLSECYSVWR